jgi:2'-5' RNA ligase
MLKFAEMTNNDGKMRLFIALPVPDELKRSVSRRLTRMDTRHIPGFRWVTEENWHITLVFLGDQKEENVPAILGAMDETKAVTGGRGIEVIFKKFVYGPPGRREVRMLWLETAEETARIIHNVKKILERNLEAAGIAWTKDERSIGQHITLARFPFSPAFRLPPLPGDFSERFRSAGAELVRSTLTPRGPIYEVLDRIAF